MRFAVLAAAALFAIAATQAAAQKDKPLLLAPGMVFYAPDGTVAGTIREVSGPAVVVDTGSNIVTLGAESFVAAKIGPTIGYTRAELDAAVDAIERDREARLTAAIAIGANLRSSDGEDVGTIRRINSDSSVVVAQDERAFTLQRSQLATDAMGGLVLRFSSDQLEAALENAGG